MNEQSKKQNELRVEDEFEKQYEDSLKILFGKLNKLIVDAASLDVFIVKGNYLIKEVGDTDSLDFIKFLAEQKPINCEILARTQIQISGDCATVLPASGVGELSQKDIIDYHKQQVEIAQRTYKERIEFVRALIRQIIDYIRNRT